MLAPSLVGRLPDVDPARLHRQALMTPYQQIGPADPLLPVGRNGLTGVSNSGVTVGRGESYFAGSVWLFASSGRAFPCRQIR